MATDTFDVPRPLIWRNEYFDYWYRQNVMLFTKGRKVQELRAEGPSNNACIGRGHPPARASPWSVRNSSYSPTVQRLLPPSPREGAVERMSRILSRLGGERPAESLITTPSRQTISLGRGWGVAFVYWKRAAEGGGPIR